MEYRNLDCHDQNLIPHDVTLVVSDKSEWKHG